MSSEEARQIVSDGLERRKEERAQRDAELDRQERMLRLTINGNHTDRTMSEAQQKERQRLEAVERRKQREQERIEAEKRCFEAEDAVRRYGVVCLVILLMTAVTRANLWVMASLALGMGVFPAVHIFRLFYPAEESRG